MPSEDLTEYSKEPILLIRPHFPIFCSMLILKTKLLIALLICCNVGTFAQTASYGGNDSVSGLTSSQGFHFPVIQTSGKGIKDFIPANWVLKDSSTGDLNGDHIPDLALVIQSKDSINELRPDNSFNKAKPVILLIFFRNIVSQYDLVLQNNTVILRSGEGGWDGDPFTKLTISKQILSLTFDMARGFSIYKFRFQRANFYLIGAISEESGHGSTYNTEVNFLTRKEKDIETDGESYKTKWLTIIPGPLIKLKDLKMIGMLEIHTGVYL